METEITHNPTRFFEVLMLIGVIILASVFQIVSIPIRAAIQILTLLDAEAMAPALLVYRKWEEKLTVAREEA